jgi:probable F420-dependent oxidoreductase
MEIGLLIPLAAPYATREFVAALGTRAETAGFSSLWVGEHVIVPANWESDYPLSEDGKIPSAIRYGELDPYTTLCYLAGLTETIRLGACTIVPQRNPVYTAKEIANADWLSGGRIDFGAGIGWSKEEFDATGSEFPRRGGRCKSYLQLMRALWESEVAEFHDDFYDMPASLLYPKPLQNPRLPIHILGDSKAAMKRVATVGDGFFPLDKSPEEMADLLKLLDQVLAEESRSREEIKISVSPYTRAVDLDMVKQYRDVGVEQVVLFQFVEDMDDMARVVDEFAENIVLPAQNL